VQLSNSLFTDFDTGTTESTLEIINPYNSSEIEFRKEMGLISNTDFKTYYIKIQDGSAELVSLATEFVSVNYFE